MKIRMSYPRRRSVYALLVIACIFGVAAGLVGSAGAARLAKAKAGDSGVAAAQARVNAAAAPVKFTLTTPIKGGVAKARGKKVFFLANLVSLPFVQEQLKSLRAAMSEVGVKVDAGASNGNVSEAARLLRQAVTRKYDAVVINSIPSKLLANELRNAKSKGVPVIQQFERDPSAPTAADRALGVFGHVTFNYSETGRLMADYVIANSGGNAKAVAIGSPDTITSPLQTNAMKKEFAKYCASCSFRVADVLISEWATRMGPVTSTIVADRKVNYLMPVWDGMGTFVIPQVKLAQAQKRVKLVTSNGDLAQMKLLAKGEIVAADIGDPLEWAGWATADQTLRALVGVQPVADEKIPLRMFHRGNVASIDVNGPPAAWYGNVDAPAEYRKLWGLK